MNIIDYMIEEDIGFCDITTDSLIDDDIVVNGQIISKEEGILSGLRIVEYIFNKYKISFELFKKEGEKLQKGDIVLKFKGNGREILKIERTLLNLLMRMCGIASKTKQLSDKVKTVNSKVKIAGTRKTFPSLAKFDKQAIVTGGGDSHRFRLDDLVLIKDNHIAIIGSISKAIILAKEKVSFSKKIEVEVEDIDNLIVAVQNGADIVMLDNFSPDLVEKAILTLNKLNIRNKVLLEVSGGITEENILDYAFFDIDIISLGSLTHSVKSLDLSLEIF
ncbi:carboxylating nicotinate-nucleotide diphosphorylase [Methanobrevibacter curvatus]|uniref:Nicotinate-nucleotide pyrophosphorylase [carboxylating] n=1 Tax=Methanobrevibacter curvatus TaxID=49547 RepID=A0A165ZDR7_9EURY|nr:carboxylating nicotinate-nucleotide diphosphorylase [Methanobrevibacter curvatus]KZX10584.1 putative nicotinate-nucleotide pyrophosphorylase [Methanobrevibacter curvatus]